MTHTAAANRHLNENPLASFGLRNGHGVNQESGSPTEREMQDRRCREMQDRRNNPLNSGCLTLPAAFDDVGVISSVLRLYRR